MKKLLSDLNVQQMQELTAKYNQPSYRAGQIYAAVMNHTPISQSNIGKEFKYNLVQEFEDIPLSIIASKSAQDATVKFLFELADKNIIEGVLMRYNYGNTVCISTQVGCRMGCVFCASGKGGLIRNLTSGEMLSQVAAINHFDGGSINKRKVTNIVLMGSGEPLDNYQNTVDFIKNINAPQGLNISTRNISLSTCGIVPNIKKLAQEGLQVNLTISLHSAFDQERAKIMPTAKTYKIAQIIDACDYYFTKTHRRYIFEYTLIQGVNDRPGDILELAKILKGKPCHINLIRLNQIKENDLRSTDQKQAYRFMGELIKAGLSVSLRRSLGSDIDGACGQLRNKFVGDKSLENKPK